MRLRGDDIAARPLRSSPADSCPSPGVLTEDSGAVTGRVLLLNGTSSAGKTTLAQLLVRELPTPWIHLRADNVLGGYPFQHPAADPATV